MGQKTNQSSNNFRRSPPSCYGDGHQPIPAAGEDRDASVYRNPVGAQSGFDLEGQRKGPVNPQAPTAPLARRSSDDRNSSTDDHNKSIEEPSG